MADYVSGEEKCDAPAPNGASVCALPPGHENQHRNAWYAPWPASGRCTYVYGSGGDRCSFVNGDAHHNHRTDTGLGYMHQDQWRPVQGAATVTDAPGKRSDDEIDKMVNGLRRKVRAQANQINKLEDLRRAAVDKQPEYQKLIGQLEAQASLTERENRFRRKAETDRDSERERRTELIGNLLMDIRAAVGDPVDSVPPSWATWSELRKQTGRLINMRASERERGDRFQEELRQALAKLNSAESAEVRTERTSRFVDRFYRLAALLTDDTAGETWDTLLQRVADLKAELEVERVRANARKAELDKLNVRLTDPFDPRMFLGPSAEYGTTPLAARVAELAKRVNELEHETVRRCEAWNSGTRCVGYPRHAGAHSGPGTERWA